jgi:predicted transcriptional regulator
MKVAVQKKDGHLAFEEIPSFEKIGEVLQAQELISEEVGSLKRSVGSIKEEIGSIGEELSVIKELLMSGKNGQEIQKPEFDFSPLTKTKKQKKITKWSPRYAKRPRINAPSDLTGKTRQIYDLILEGKNTSKVIASAANISIEATAATLIDLYDYGFVERVENPENKSSFVYRKGGDMRIKTSRQATKARSIKRPTVKTPEDLKGVTKKSYELVLKGYDTAEKIAAQLTGTSPSAVSTSLQDLHGYGFLERGKVKDSKAYSYWKGGDKRTKRKPRDSQSAPLKELTGIHKKIFDGIAQRRGTSKEIAATQSTTLGTVRVTISELFKKHYIYRRMEHDKNGRNNFIYSTTPFTDAPKEKPKVEAAPKEPPNSFEISVRGYAKSLGLVITELAIKELAQNKDWSTILKHAKHEGIWNISHDTVRSLRSKLHAPKPILAELEGIQTEEKNEKPFLLPGRMVSIVGDDAEKKMLDFIRQFEEKKEITFKDFLQFLYGMDEQEAYGFFMGWFQRNAHWLIRRALGDRVKVTNDLGEKKIIWVG